MHNASAAAKDLLEWKWRGAQGSGGSEFGNPTAATSYDLCVYDATGLLTSISVPAAGGCDSLRAGRRPQGRFTIAAARETPTAPPR
jgi:hypothetical protein